ncbi:MAG: acetylglucosamine-6-sulfatase [Planctomycetaceae bacterium]|nr:GDSL family lipase [Planctomycetales bacterium]MCB9941819.1 acetylglucosamine-6-sulfatase [Planctomycetaceae bacterium]
MKTKTVLSSCFTLLMCAVPLCAQDSATLIRATDPEVQTAAWAQKWWMPRHEEKLAALKEQGRVDLLMIGDSITHGWEGAGKEVWDKYYASRNAFNLGFSGDRTEQLLWRFDHGEIDGIAPKLAVIMIGTNNTGHRQDPPEETAAGIKAIIERLNKKLPETKVLLLAVFPRGATTDDALRKINDGINERISKFADGERVFYLDINQTFLTDDGTLTKEIMPDLLHPKQKGYQMWADAMEPTVARLLGEK